MPINPTTLKALIDTQITNETVDFAITPAEVGGRMKDTIDYTTEQIATVAVTPDATTLLKGKLQLAGDLGGTASLPTVPGLASKVDLTTSQAIDGVKTFIQQPQVPGPDSDSDAVNKLYVDNKIVTNVLKTTISLSEVNSLFTTPIIILPSVIGFARIPIRLYTVRGFSSAYTLANNFFDITNNAGSVYGLSINMSVLASTGPVYSNNVLSFDTNGAGSIDSSFKLKAKTADPTGGTAGIDVYVTYIEIKL